MTGSWLTVATSLWAARRSASVAPAITADARRGWTNLTSPFARSSTCAATAGSSVRAAMPAASISSSLGAPTTATTSSAALVSSLSAPSRCPTRCSRESGTGSGWERIDGDGRRVEGTGELQRIERITARNLVQAQHRRAREHPAEPVANQALDRAQAERADRQTLDVSGQGELER